MADKRSYETFMLSDEPKIFGIPIVSGLPCIALTVMGLVSGYTFQFFVVGAIISFILHVKFGGQGIRLLLSIVYWTLPNKMTKSLFGLRRSPDSSHRVYLK